MHIHEDAFGNIIGPQTKRNRSGFYRGFFFLSSEYSTVGLTFSPIFTAHIMEVIKMNEREYLEMYTDYLNKCIDIIEKWKEEAFNEIESDDED